MENEEKKVDNTTTTDTHTETVEKVDTINTDVRPVQPNFKNWILLIALVVLVVVLGFYVKSCSENQGLEKKVVETSKSLETTNATVKKLGEEVAKNAAELRALEAAYQDSLDWANNPQWSRDADSLAYEYSQKKEGGKK